MHLNAPEVIWYLIIFTPRNLDLKMIPLNTFNSSFPSLYKHYLSVSMTSETRNAPYSEHSLNSRVSFLRICWRQVAKLTMILRSIHCSWVAPPPSFENSAYLSHYAAIQICCGERKGKIWGEYSELNRQGKKKKLGKFYINCSKFDFIAFIWAC